MEIINRYGDMDAFSAKFSYQNVYAVAEDPIQALSSGTPSLVRLDVAYGKGSARQWLYRILQPTFMFLGVNTDRFPKEMVYDLAGTIASNPMYNKLTVVEIMLFISRFKSGMYGRFFGDTSYALTVTEALRSFWSDRGSFYSQVERMEAERKAAEERKKCISYKEWKRMKEEKGEKVSFSIVEVEGRDGKELSFRPINDGQV